MTSEDTWHMTEWQQWTSLFIVIVVVLLVVAGLYVLWRDARRDQSVKQWTEDFIPDSSEVVTAEKIRDRMQALRKGRTGA